MSKKGAEKDSRIKPSGGADWVVFVALIFLVLWGASYMRTGENAFKDVHFAPGQAVEMIHVPVTPW